MISLLDIDTSSLEAGPETDRLVVEYIFEKKVCKCDKPSFCGYGPGHCLNCDGWVPELHSSSISPAFEVVSKIGIRWIIDCVPEFNQYVVRCEYLAEETSVRIFDAPTLSLAICRAALEVRKREMLEKEKADATQPLS